MIFYVYVPMWVYVRSVCANAHRDQEVLDLKLELQAVVNTMLWVLGTQVHWKSSKHS